MAVTPEERTAWLKAVPFGKAAGRIDIPILRALFAYASEHDVDKGGMDDIFDARSGAINLWGRDGWEKPGGSIHSTLYVDWGTGDVTLDAGTHGGPMGSYDEKGRWGPGKDWEEGYATDFWNKAIWKAVSVVRDVPPEGHVKCPLCDRYIKAPIFNDFVDAHLVGVHSLKVLGVVLGSKTVVRTTQGDYEF